MLTMQPFTRPGSGQHRGQRHTAYNSLIYSDRVVSAGKINDKKGTFLCLLFFEIR